MGVKRDNVPFAGGERGGRSPPKKVAKRRSSLCGCSGLTNPQAEKHRRPNKNRPDTISGRSYSYQDIIILYSHCWSELIISEVVGSCDALSVFASTIWIARASVGVTPLGLSTQSAFAAPVFERTYFSGFA